MAVVGGLQGSESRCVAPSLCPVLKAPADCQCVSFAHPVWTLSPGSLGSCFYPSILASSPDLVSPLPRCSLGPACSLLPSFHPLPQLSTQGPKAGLSIRAIVILGRCSSSTSLYLPPLSVLSEYLPSLPLSCITSFLRAGLTHMPDCQ